MYAKIVLCLSIFFRDSVCSLVFASFFFRFFCRCIVLQPLWFVVVRRCLSSFFIVVSCCSNFAGVSLLILSLVSFSRTGPAVLLGNSAAVAFLSSRCVFVLSGSVCGALGLICVAVSNLLPPHPLLSCRKTLGLLATTASFMLFHPLRCRQ